MSRLQDMASGVLAKPTADPAIQFEGHWYSWGEVIAVATKVQRLIAAIGAGADAAALLIAHNLPTTLAALLGLMASGRSVRMLYSFQSPELKARQIAQLRPSVVIAAQQDYAEELQAALHDCGAAAIALSAIDAQLLPGLESCRRGSPAFSAPRRKQGHAFWCDARARCAGRHFQLTDFHRLLRCCLQFSHHVQIFAMISAPTRSWPPNWRGAWTVARVRPGSA
jgi:hypothetical protein